MQLTEKSVNCIDLSDLGSPARVEELLMEVNEKVRRLEIKYKAKSDAKKVRYEFVRMPGEKPGHAVLEVSKQSGAIFIVTGSRGMGKIKRTVMGSVSDYILHHSPVPVLICRHKEKDNR
ncbi:stress in QAH OAS sulfhydrylase 3 region-like isoform X1 [Octopus vulgaris]|uniref:Stress in QAH OAS sulfhydrylase 3 region-like isoform X1 n=1 Tax=Octopus vulgaris TaxID=6645 RepID=A0AA36ATR2_OCTVU|nr:stress in QAH OAS sulfhydrylase 3 region-like isoform X1 [Octopus vulgaris]